MLTLKLRTLFAGSFRTTMPIEHVLFVTSPWQHSFIYLRPVQVP